jgi:hypothetical protein
VILDPIDDHVKFVFDMKKDDVVGVITTYILREIHFHLSGIDFLHQFWKKIKTLFAQVDENHVMLLEKQLISLKHHSFERMEDYLVHVKELQLKFGECGKNYQKKDGKLIELVLMNLRTPFEVFVSTFHTNWKERKENGKDYTFESFYGILIID